MQGSSRKSNCNCCRASMDRTAPTLLSPKTNQLLPFISSAQPPRAMTEHHEGPYLIRPPPIRPYDDGIPILLSGCRPESRWVCRALARVLLLSHPPLTWQSPHLPSSYDIRSGHCMRHQPWRHYGTNKYLPYKLPCDSVRTIHRGIGPQRLDICSRSPRVDHHPDI